MNGLREAIAPLWTHTESRPGRLEACENWGFWVAPPVQVVGVLRLELLGCEDSVVGTCVGGRRRPCGDSVGSAVGR